MALLVTVKMLNASHWMACEGKRLIAYGRVSPAAENEVWMPTFFHSIVVGNVCMSTVRIEPLSHGICWNGLYLMVAREAARFWNSKRLASVYRKKMFFRLLLENGPLKELCLSSR